MDNAYMTERESPHSKHERPRKQYWDEFSLVEELREFHSEAFAALSCEEHSALLEYYPLDKGVPDVYAHKLDLEKHSPEQVQIARQAYYALRAHLGVQSPTERH
jgi:hypothetical protein